MSEKTRMRLKISIVLLGFAAGFTLCAVAGYFITRLLPEMPAAATVIVSLWIGFALFILLSQILRVCAEAHHKNERRDPWKTILTAMEQISRGDFSVFIPENEDLHFTGLAKAVNDMAKNLGTLETMRQDFISNVSHEIQSPLTSIGGFAALLKNDALPAQERRRYAEIIEAESKRLSSLSDNLLKLSSLDDSKTPLNMKDFRLDKQLERATLALEPQWAAKKLTLEADLRQFVLSGDEDLLSQVWTNLLHNAIKFTPKGGRIGITLAPDGEAAVVRISDSGAGIAPEDQIHIFERFYKADKARDRNLGGNGLGLSLVKKIVELHDGRIFVTSETGKGAAFEIFLPNKRIENKNI